MQVARIRLWFFETNFPLKKIAERNGFEHVEYMCVVLKRLTGEPPGGCCELLRAPVCCAALWFSFAVTQAGAQTAPAGAESTAASSPHAAPATPEAEPEDASVVVLDPFQVLADEDAGTYRATSTLAGTRVRTDLKDVASSISVVTSQFMQDTGSKNSQDLLVYTVNTEIGGIHGNFSGAGGAATYNENANLLRPSNNTRVRGLDAADNTRDYFLTEIPWDGYIVDRVDLQRGPNSILFGVGSPSGIINTSLNTAIYRDSFKFENRMGQYGSMRNSFDITQSVIDEQFALRVAGLDDRTKYRQDPAYNNDRRIFGALRVEPRLFGEGTRTSLRANYERGEVRANRPRQLPPIDAISPWFLTGTSNGFQNLNKLTLDPNTTWNQYGNNPDYPSSTYPWFREAFMGRLMNSNIAFFHDADDPAPMTTQMPNVGTAYGRNSDGNIDGTIGDIPFGRPWGIATYNNYARVAVPGGRYYSNVSLKDREVFDFYNHLMDGRNKSESQNWDAANIALSQTFLNNRLGFEFVYDMQRYDDTQISFLQGDQFQISVDINTHLLDGSVNPNVGRPYVGNSGQYGNSENTIDRDGQRLTAFAEIRADDFMERGLLSRFLGRHVFTGLLSQDDKRTDYRGFSRWASDPAYTDVTGGSASIIDGARQIDFISYIGPDLRGASSPAVHLSPVTARINPTGFADARYFDSHWNAPGVPFGDPYTYTTYDAAGQPVTNTGTQADNSANYVGWTRGSFGLLNYDNPADRASLYSGGQKAHNEIKSMGLVWQGYMLEDVIVPTVGWRHDEVSNASATAPKGANGVSLMSYGVDESDALEVAGDSFSYGVVVHTPQTWRDALPGKTHVSVFYNNSENFKADAPRGDVFGNIIPNPVGDTEDYGVVVSTLDDRLVVKATWYETKVKNASLQADYAGFSTNIYYAWAIGYWGSTHALAALDGIADPQLRQGSWGWPWNGIATDAQGNPDTARIRTIAEAWFANFPWDQNWADQYGLGLDVDAMRAATTDAERYASVPTYGLNPRTGVYDPIEGAGASALDLQPAYGGGLAGTGAAPVAAVDTASKGLELEVMAQLTKSWNLTLNISKTEATRTAISPTIDTWIADVTEFLATDAGLIRLWGADPMRTVWANSIVAPYEVLKAQIGSSAPEVAPWRCNAVTNYTFKEGVLRGFNVGLAYRWEDSRILGYRYDATGDILDIDHPWMEPTDSHFDGWVGYGRRFGDKVDWRIQLNMRNLGENTHLVPVNIQPDGEVALSRIQEGMAWQITNTFSF